MLSMMVTVAVQVELFPLWSVTVNVTVFAPRFEHVNEFGLTVIDAIVQLSVEPLLICAAVMDAVPEEFNATVMF